MNFFCPRISLPMNASKLSMRSWVCSFVMSHTRPMKPKYSSGVRKSMRKLSSMYAPVYLFHSSLSEGSIFSVASVLLSVGVSNVMQTLPSFASVRSSIRRKSVVFPAPLLPSRPIICPFGTLKSEMSTAVLSPYFFFRLLMFISILLSVCLFLLHAGHAGCPSVSPDGLSLRFQSVAYLMQR